VYVPADRFGSFESLLSLDFHNPQGFDFIRVASLLLKNTTETDITFLSTLCSTIPSTIPSLRFEITSFEPEFNEVAVTVHDDRNKRSVDLQFGPTPN
jgi:hypothetical protein